MKTIIYIIIFCCFIYKTGAIKTLLKRFQVADAEPARTPPQVIQEPPNDRARLENEAYYILVKQEYEHPETVRYMGDDMLIDIIHNYLYK